MVTDQYARLSFLAMIHRLDFIGCGVAAQQGVWLPRCAANDPVHAGLGVGEVNDLNGPRLSLPGRGLPAGAVRPAGFFFHSI